MSDVVKYEKITDIPNSEIIQLMAHFETSIGYKLRPRDEQRRYAKFLIKDYTYPVVIRAIDAVVAARDNQFFPSITSLTDLHFKWGKVVEFYRRNQPKKQSNVTDLDNI